MSSDLKTKAVAAVGWKLVERFSAQGAQFLCSIILARLLSPQDFGVIALVTVFITLAQVLIDGGFGDALVQKKNLDDRSTSSVFYCNIAIGLFCAMALSVAAPGISRFYDTPVLADIIPVLSLNLVLGGFGVVHNAILVKRLEFGASAKVSVVATVLSGTIGVSLALLGVGVWSLVFQSLSFQAARVILLWCLNPWRPQFRLSFSAISLVAGFGSGVLLANVTEVLFGQLYIAVIGKQFSPSVLGLYSRADQLHYILMANLATVVSGVAFPLMSTIQGDTERLRSALKSAVALLAFVAFPIMAGLAAVAQPLVLVLLTAKWAACVPYIQLLCGVWFLYPLSAVNLSVLLAQGDSRRYVKVQLIKKSVTLTALAATFRLGISAMILGQIASAFVCYYINCYYSGKLLKYSMIRQIADGLPYLLFSLIMGSFVFALGCADLVSPLLQLIVQTVLGVAFYGLLCHAFKLPALEQALQAGGQLRLRFGKRIELTMGTAAVAKGFKWLVGKLWTRSQS